MAVRVNRRLLLPLAVVALVVASGVAAGVIAGRGKLDGVFKEQPNDSDVVATVNGVQVLRRQVRLTMDVTSIGASDLSPDDVAVKAIVSAVGQALQYAEALRRGLEAPIEDAQAYIASLREQCYGPQGQECRDGIKQLGVPEEEYWENALEGSVRNLSVANLWRQVFAENGLTNAPNDELLAFKASYLASLHESANIQWQDPTLESIYNRALH